MIDVANRAPLLMATVVPATCDEFRSMNDSAKGVSQRLQQCREAGLPSVQSRLDPYKPCHGLVAYPAQVS